MSSGFEVVRDKMSLILVVVGGAGQSGHVTC